jgi:hypothetical protein
VGRGRPLGSGAKADAITSLTASIVEMPLTAQAIHDARSTAYRLILLLPNSPEAALGDASSPTTPIVVPQWGWMLLVFFWMYLALNAGLALSHHRLRRRRRHPCKQPNSRTEQKHYGAGTCLPRSCRLG